VLLRTIQWMPTIEAPMKYNVWPTAAEYLAELAKDPQYVERD
jgi:hypothetical protein